MLAGVVSPDRGRIANQDYLDLSIRIPANKHLIASLCILNVLDQDPPLIASGSLIGVLGNGNTFPQVYDPLGRFVQPGLPLQL